MVLEGFSFFDALYLTVITLATVGYGDIAPRTISGRVFAMGIVVFGLATFTFALQAIFTTLTSPSLREARQKRLILQKVKTFEGHTILCGSGEMVDRAISYLLNLNASLTPPQSPYQIISQRLRHFFLAVSDEKFTTSLTESLVIVTHDATYADTLRQKGLWVILGHSTDVAVLSSSAIHHAGSMVVMGNSDTETLLTVLTARSINRTVTITAAVLDEKLNHKMLQVGANNVIAPYAVAGSFLNNGTFRPAVNDFYSNLVFDSSISHSMMELRISETSVWAGKTLAELPLGQNYDTDVIGLRGIDGDFTYVPDKSHIIQPEETLLAVGPSQHINPLKALSQGTTRTPGTLWQPLPFKQVPPKSDKVYSLQEAENAIQSLNKHYIICGSGLVAQRAIDALNPDRPFVIVSTDKDLTDELLARGFRAITGNPTEEQTLIKAGIKRAQAIMVTLEEEAEAIVTILTCRTLNKQLLITSTAYKDEMIPKLERAGADRIVSPFRVAAAFTLLTTNHPNISDFLKHVMFNYQTGLETTELYMENESPWIGRSVGSLDLKTEFKAGVVGIRLADHSYCYAPSDDHIIQDNEVLIVITPMTESDTLRELAHGHISKRPATLRTRVIQSSRWTPDEIAQMMNRPKELK